MIRTSEMVSEGHPDKVADYLSDNVLDYYLSKDPTARVACETLIKNNNVVFAGEITAKEGVDQPNFVEIVNTALESIGYTECYSIGTPNIINFLDRQSPDIGQGVTEAVDGGIGSGDQGMMYGFATRETEELLPLPYVMARNLLLRLKQERVQNKLFGPDAKSQVSIEYENGSPKRCSAVVISTQHAEEFDINDLRSFVKNNIIKTELGNLYDEQTRVYINATGRFVIGGPVGDCGLTGRKIVVDQYGGFAPQGGGAQSGKDPSKTDRSALYFARWVAAKSVYTGLADQVLIEVAYSIGVAHPVAINVTSNRNQYMVEDFVRQFDFRPDSIIERLNLLRPIYTKSTNYGHFTNKELPWNKFEE